MKTYKVKPSQNFAERQVRYNCRRPSSDADFMEWFFLIINTEDEIEQIKAGIYNLFAPILTEGQDYNGTVKGTGLIYKLINFTSSKKVEQNDISKIFIRMFKDRNLYYRRRTKDLSDYLEGQLEQ